MARPHPILIDIAAGRVPAGPGDDRRLLVSAQEHRMEGQLWSCVRRGDLDLPRVTEQQLATRVLSTRDRHNRLRDRLVRSVDRLAESGFESLTFKGVSAEIRWHERQGDRPSTDVDLLLEPAAAMRAGEVVAALQPDHILAPVASEIVQRGALKAIPVKFEGMHIDLHFRLPGLGGSPKTIDAAWTYRVDLDLGNGRVVKALAPEHALVHALINLNLDRFSHLMWFTDITRLIERHPELDWGVVDDFVRMSGFAVPVYRSLEVVHEELGLDASGLPQIRGIGAWVWSALWSSRTRLLGDPGVARRRRRKHLLGLFGRGNRLAALKSWVLEEFPPRPVLEFRYPGLSRRPYLWSLFSAKLKARKR